MTAPKLGFCFENFEVTFMVCQPFRYICYFYISSVLVIMINEIWTYVLICFPQKCLHLARIPKQYHLSSTWLPQALVTCSRQEFNPRGCLHHLEHTWHVFLPVRLPSTQLGLPNAHSGLHLILHY